MVDRMNADLQLAGQSELVSPAPDYGILVVSDDAGLRSRLADLLRGAWESRLSVDFASSLHDDLTQLADPEPLVIFVEVPEQREKVESVIRSIMSVAQSTPVIVLGDDREPSIWSSVIGVGAQDYMSVSELAESDIRRIVHYAIERQTLQSKLEENLDELERAKTQFQSLITDNADALLIVSHAKIVRYANPAAERLLGCSLRELVGNPFTFIVDTQSVVEVNHATGDGGSVILAIRYMDTLWEGERAYIATLRDITDRKNAERALSVAKQRAEGANKLKSQFLASMSHELRTPLNSILGFSELIGMEMHGALGHASYKGYVANIANAGNHLLELINDLLDLSKIEAGELELYEEPLDVSELIASVVEVLKPKLASGGLSLSVTAEALSVKLMADERKIKQILFNLLSNAIKFTPSGGRVEIGSRIAGGALVVFVTDSGIGIPEDQIPRALSAFGQVDNGHTRRPQEGTGLGLTLSKRIAELHGGRLEIESVVGKGTTVSVSFPAERLVESA